MSRRLPVLGGVAAPTGVGVERAIGIAEVRPHVPLPTVAVVSASPVVVGAGELACALVKSLVVAGQAVGALVSEVEGRRATEAMGRLRKAGASEVKGLPPGAVDRPGALEDVFVELRGADVVVAWGAELPRWRTPTLTVMVTGALLPVAFAPEGRALLPLCDVRLADAREGFAQSIAAAWSGTFPPPTGGADSATCPQPPLR